MAQDSTHFAHAHVEFGVPAREDWGLTIEFGRGADLQETIRPNSEVLFGTNTNSNGNSSSDSILEGSVELMGR